MLSIPKAMGPHFRKDLQPVGLGSSKEIKARLRKNKMQKHKRELRNGCLYGKNTGLEIRKIAYFTPSSRVVQWLRAWAPGAPGWFSWVSIQLSIQLRS